MNAVHFDAADFFLHWYLGGFLVGFGLWLILGAKRLNDLRRAFPGKLSDEMRAAIARRQELEALPLAMWRVPGAINLLLGIAVLGTWLNGLVGYGLGTCAFATSLGIGYLSMRNRGATRAAVLAPRTLTSIVPLAWYPVAAIVALAPLTYLDVPAFALAAVLTCIATMAIFAFAMTSNNMASIMPGIDPELELRVDQQLRCCRVLGLFGVGMGVPFVFVALSFPVVPSSIARDVAYWLGLLAWVVFVAPIVAGRIRKRFARG